jgi:hypothetical protein
MWRVLLWVKRGRAKAISLGRPHAHEATRIAA